METLGRLATAKLGNLCSRPQMLLDNIPSLPLDGGSLWPVTHFQKFSPVSQKDVMLETEVEKE